MLKIGIIGFGYMGRFHQEKIARFQNAELTCIYDTDEGKRREALKDGIQAYESLDEFFKSDVELVVIATPNQWHTPYAIAAMRSGKNVLCEKPAAMSVAELQQVAACCEQTGRFFTVHQQRRWDADYRAVCEVVGSKRIGKVTTIESRVFGQRGVCFGWRADPASGGGMLYDWGVHLIDQMLMLYSGEGGRVTSVYARILSVLTPAVDDFFEIVLMFANGVCAKVSVATFVLQKLPRWFVFGDRGTMCLDDFTGTQGGISRIKGEVKGFESVVENKEIGPSRTMAPLKADQIEHLTIPKEDDMDLEFWDNLIKATEGRSMPYVTMEQLMRQMQVLEAAFLSARKNEVVKTFI
ncbi:MAG: Gfo/Idh/MocA family oxidoreductase [Eubacterium sp.]|nr:Gfo/Idh/MocA family oxidoreductase [Eubacterium sp.]